MLTEHGVLPHVVLALPLREQLLMSELIKRQAKEIKEKKKG
jgi:hypothetical protein